MRETIEFRVDEDYASKLFADGEGAKLGIARKITIAIDDPRFAMIGELQRTIKSDTNRSFFYGWRVKRQYTREELAGAKLFKLVVAATIEPSGEECGTKYDESTACPRCGAGATQISELRLDLRKVPKGKEIVTTIANEIVVSQYLAERMTDAGLTGYELRPVRHKAQYEDDPLDLHRVPTGRRILQKAQIVGAPHPTGRFYVWLNRAENRGLWDQARAESVALKGEKSKQRWKPMPVWHQLVVTSITAEIAAPTRVGINPFDNDSKAECRCPLGDLIGLNLLSEVSISGASRGESDINCSRQFIGVRRGLLRPHRVIFIYTKFWNLLESERIKGIEVEVVHLI
jgi:hypothetical protein